MTAIEKVVQLAWNEVGMLEKSSYYDLDSKTGNAGNKNYTKYARDLDKLGTFNGPKQGYAWCAVFVTWLFVQTFGLYTAMKMLLQFKGGYGASCTWASNRYKAQGRLYKTPQVGDQIFFTADGGKSSNHTGIVVEVKDGKVYTIEGNTSSSAGVVANGGGVFAKSYALNYSKILGYGRPDWSLAQKEKEDEVDMSKQEVQELVAQEVAKAVAEVVKPTKVYTRLEELPWGRESVERLMDAGIIQGDGTGKLHLTDHDLVTVSMVDKLMLQFLE